MVMQSMISTDNNYSQWMPWGMAPEARNKEHGTNAGIDKKQLFFWRQNWWGNDWCLTAILGGSRGTWESNEADIEPNRLLLCVGIEHDTANTAKKGHYMTLYGFFV